ncbi:MAG: hypothetical protein AAF586_00705 [Planctomycetota bacterium]
MNPTRHNPRPWGWLAIATLALALPAWPAPAQQADAVAEPTVEPAAAVAEPGEDVPAAGASGEPGVDEVLQQLMNRRVTDPTPTTQPAAIGGAGEALPQAPIVPVPPAAVEIDPAVLGVAPGDPIPTLRREGEFLINRRGRLLRSPEGYQLFVFEGDGMASPELPMIVQPSRLLQAMEDIVSERGDAVVFVLSGQVHAYRGANYLLPTMMKIAIPKGNLGIDS